MSRRSYAEGPGRDVRAMYASHWEVLREALEDAVPLPYPLFIAGERTGIDTPTVVATILDRLPNELHRQFSDLLDDWAEIRLHEIEPGEQPWE